MNRNELAITIAQDLLDNDTLDIDNFCNDVEAILQLVQQIILKRLEGYLIVSGSVM